MNVKRECLNYYAMFFDEDNTDFPPSRKSYKMDEENADESFKLPSHIL